MTATAVEPAYITPTGIYTDGYLGAKAFTGGRYTGYRWYAEITKDIRADIKRAIKGMHLPGDLTYSVSGEAYSGGQSITIEIRGLMDSQVRTENTYVNIYGVTVTEYPMTPAAIELERRLKALGEAYNYDNSNAMVDHFDTMYYLRVNFESERAREWRLKDAAAKKSKRAAVTASKAVTAAAKPAVSA
jgi:hypothetical protein